MEEKRKKILGLVFGIIAPGALFGLTIPFMFIIGIAAVYVGLFFILLFPAIFNRQINSKYYFTGLAINIVGLIAGLLVFLGACAEHPFMGSPDPGAGGPFFIAAAVAGIFAVALFIIAIKVLINSKSEPEKVQSGSKMKIWAE